MNLINLKCQDLSEKIPETWKIKIIFVYIIIRATRIVFKILLMLDYIEIARKKKRTKFSYCIQWWGSKSGDLSNVKYLLVAIK